jgi:hypothetical protein
MIVHGSQYGSPWFIMKHHGPPFCLLLFSNFCSPWRYSVVPILRAPSWIWCSMVPTVGSPLWFSMVSILVAPSSIWCSVVPTVGNPWWYSMVPTVGSPLWYSMVPILVAPSSIWCSVVFAAWKRHYGLFIPSAGWRPDESRGAKYVHGVGYRVRIEI